MKTKRSTAGYTDRAACAGGNVHHKERRNTRAVWLCICLIVPLSAACSPAGISGSSTPGKDAAASTALYVLTTGDAGGRTNTDKIYVALAGDRARIYQQGADAAFCLGTFPAVKDGNRLEIVISEQNRRESIERVAQTFDEIALKIEGTPAAPANPASMAGPDSRLENILLFCDGGILDDMAVSVALSALGNDRLHTILGRIQNIKESFIFDRLDTGDPTANFIRARDGVKQPVARLLAHEKIRNVFYEKEMLGSLLSDMDAMDREIARCYADGAGIVRGESTGATRNGTIEKMADTLERLEHLSATAARLERQYSRFMTMIGFEENVTARNQVLVSAWNAALWQAMAGCFQPEETDQYDILNDVCRPLDRLRMHCAMAGDAACALRALEAFDSLVGPNSGNAKIILRRADAAWTGTDRHITLRPVTDSCLVDRRISVKSFAPPRSGGTLHPDLDKSLAEAILTAQT